MKNEQEKGSKMIEEQKVSKGIRWEILVMITIIVALAIAAMVGFCVYNMPERLLARELDLGRKYLQEEEYEQAIAAFDAAIEIDPKNTDAYMGKANAYAGMEDMDAAIVVLEQGYELTESERIQEKLNELRGSMEEMEVETATVEENINYLEELNGLGIIKDNRWVNPKIKVDDEVIRVIREVIDLGNNGQYQKASQLIGSDEFVTMVEKYSSEISGGLVGSTINTLYDNYIIYISHNHVNPSGHACTFRCIPEKGNGFIISREYGTSLDGEIFDGWGYAICHVDDYRFNGTYYSCCYYNDLACIRESEVKNGYFDGEMTQTEDDSGNIVTEVYLYDNGSRVTYGEEGEYVLISKWTSNDGKQGNGRMEKKNFEEYSQRRDGPGSALMNSYVAGSTNDKFAWE